MRRPTEFVTWHCGCGRDFQARGFGRHRRDCLFRGAAWPTVVIPRPPASEAPRVD